MSVVVVWSLVLRLESRVQLDVALVGQGGFRYHSPSLHLPTP